MDKESVGRLRFDRRLQLRPDWVEKADQEAYLASLPDVSEKMTTCAEEEKSAEPAGASDVAEGAAVVAPQAPHSVATAGDFSVPSPFGNESGGN